jgi:hypothetical protein
MAVVRDQQLLQCTAKLVQYIIFCFDHHGNRLVSENYYMTFEIIERSIVSQEFTLPN